MRRGFGKRKIGHTDAKTKNFMETETKNQKLASRRENRIAAMQFLYMQLVSGANTADDLAAFFESKENDRDFYKFAEELIAGVNANLGEIDALVSKFATNWSIDRIAKVDLSILRLAIFELLKRDDIPPIVSINEAIDLAKTFSSAESKRFINGILDSVKSTLNRPLRTSNK